MMSVSDQGAWPGEHPGLDDELHGVLGWVYLPWWTQCLLCGEQEVADEEGNVWCWHCDDPVPADWEQQYNNRTR